MELIDKSALVAEIKRRIKEIDEIGTYLSPKGVLTNLLCHLDTLETKEVNLGKEIQSWVENNSVNDYYQEDVYETAEHFFELGLKVKKGE